MALAIGSDNSRLLFEKGISPAEPGPFRRVAPSGEKVESAAHLAEYLATLGGSNERKTVDMKRSTIKKFCAEFPSTADIDRQGVQQWINREASKGAAPATIRRVMSEMRGYWKYLRAIRKVADESDPFDKLSIPAGGKTAKASERKPFGTADVLRLLAEAKARDDDELADLIEIAMWTGARLEEICALPVAKVNLTGRYLDIEDAKTPAGWRQVPVHAKLLPVLRRLIGERTSGYVLATLKPNKYGDRGAWIGKEFGKMKTTMGFGADRVFHSIRKTVATLLENAGVPEGVAADIVGHDKPTMTYGLYSGGASLATKAAAIKKLAYETKGKAPKD
jgi:integrase